jgi:hypothetical protein
MVGENPESFDVRVSLTNPTPEMIARVQQAIGEEYARKQALKTQDNSTSGGLILAGIAAAVVLALALRNR